MSFWPAPCKRTNPCHALDRGPQALGDQRVSPRRTRPLARRSASPECLRRNPKELIALGIKEYRQTSFKPCRVIYRVTGSQVVIYLIADGRRDMLSVLARTLLGA